MAYASVVSPFNDVCTSAMSNRGWGISGTCSTLACDPDLASQALPQHSPSLRTQSERCGEVLDLCQRQGLGEGVGRRVIRGAWRGANGCHSDVLVVVHVDVLSKNGGAGGCAGHDGCW